MQHRGLRAAGLRVAAVRKHGADRARHDDLAAVGIWRRVVAHEVRGEHGAVDDADFW